MTKHRSPPDASDAPPTKKTKVTTTAPVTRRSGIDRRSRLFPLISSPLAPSTPTKQNIKSHDPTSPGCVGELHKNDRLSRKRMNTSDQPNQPMAINVFDGQLELLCSPTSQQGKAKKNRTGGTKKTTTIKTPETRHSSIDRRSRLFPLTQGHAQSMQQVISNTTVHFDGTYTTNTTTIPAETPTPQVQDHIEQTPTLQPHTITPRFKRAKQPLYNAILDLGLPSLTCRFCGAQFWKHEALKRTKKHPFPVFPVCCQHGKVSVPLLEETPALLDRLLDINGDALSKHYRKHIRSYNAAFSWTSFGAKIKPDLVRSRGPYSLVLCGENYHYMGSLLPEEGQRPRYAQLYVFDPTSEVNDRLSNVSSHGKDLNPGLIEALRHMLDEHNVLAQSFRQVRDALQCPENQGLRLRISGSRVETDRQYELPTGTDLAGLVPGDFEPSRDDRDIIINNRSTGLTRITSLNPLFDSLHFPLLFPHGNDGYHNRIRYDPKHVDPAQKRSNVTQREFYCFRLQYRQNEGKTLIRSGKALQHYCIDAFTTVEQNRLTFLRLNQTKLRSDIYKGLCDALHRGDLDSRNIGRTILPSTFTGSIRYMKQLYLDATSISHHFGNPDLFITFTCNSQWPEIINAFKDDVGTHGEDKPTLIARIFKMKLALFKEDLKKVRYFGRTIADMHTIEFQKRGLPHVHIIIWLAPAYKPTTADKVDRIISAELPDPTIDPIGYEAVTKFMLHGPCGEANPSCPCMKNERCSKHFPKPYVAETTFDENGSVTYRRRATNISAVKSGQNLDNSFVVPYNRNLLVKYQAHINVEICHKGQLIKYLFKYITKGPDRSEVVAENTGSRRVSHNPDDPIDEIAQYLDCRSISSYEAAWRLFQFKIHERNPTVIRLCVHLPGFQTITFDEHQPISSIVSNPNVGKTMLTQWFALNRRDPSARKYLYSDIPNAYLWDKKQAMWKPRKRGFAIGRIASVPLGADDVLYLRMLLTKIPGALSFLDLRTVNGVLCNDYQQACQALGLLSTDDEWDAVMAEVCQWGLAPLIRRTFVSMLLFCQVSCPLALFERWWHSMADDFQYRLQQLAENPIPEPLPEMLRNKVLQELHKLLQNYSSSLTHFNLPSATWASSDDQTDDLIGQQLHYDRDEQRKTYETSHASLNHCQQIAHDAIISSIQNQTGQLFFLYGHGGTGKTYLYNCILSHIRSLGKIALVVASSGIAATLLPGGVTAHSRFKIPIDVDHASTCMIKKGTSLAKLVEQTTLIVWDEAPMVHRHSFEALDRTLCDIMNTPSEGPNYKPFGGKTVLLGGDFRQTLPVVTNGSREDNVAASLTKSYLWNHCKLLELHTNMRINTTTMNTTPQFGGKTFTEWVLSVGDGKTETIRPAKHSYKDWIRIPKQFLIPKMVNPIEEIVQRVYPGLVTSYTSLEYLRNRAIVTPTNKVVSEVNDYVLGQLPGTLKTYLSADTLTTTGTNQRDLETQYPSEFLNGLSFNGMPEHKLCLKQYSIVMLLRNLNPTEGLCNGTRIMITHLGTNVLRGLIVGGSFEGTIAIIPRIVLDKKDPNWPFTLKRRQFPLRLCYAMTINKSQGQTLESVGIYLPTPVFSHGQLYVAVSRVRSADGIHIVIENETLLPGDITRNIVYNEVFEDLHPIA